MSPEICLHSVVLLIRPEPIHSSIQHALLTGLSLVSSPIAINIDSIAPSVWLNSTSRSSGPLCLHHLRIKPERPVILILHHIYQPQNLLPMVLQHYQVRLWNRKQENNGWNRWPARWPLQTERWLPWQTSQTDRWPLIKSRWPRNKMYKIHSQNDSC